MVSTLKRISDKENLDVSPEQLQQIADNADGDIRNAINSLQVRNPTVPLPTNANTDTHKPTTNPTPDQHLQPAYLTPEVFTTPTRWKRDCH